MLAIRKISDDLVIREEYFGALIFDRRSLCVTEANKNTLILLRLIDGKRTMKEVAEAYERTSDCSVENTLRLPIASTCQGRQKIRSYWRGRHWRQVRKPWLSIPGPRVRTSSPRRFGSLRGVAQGKSHRQEGQPWPALTLAGLCGYLRTITCRSTFCRTPVGRSPAPRGGI